MPLSPETPQDHDYCRIPDHDESTEKKVGLGKRKSDEKTNENFIDDIKSEGSKRGKIDFVKRMRDENSNENSMNETVDLTSKKKKASVLTLEEVFERFPKLRTEIAENLNNESIISLKTASREMNQVLEEDRSFWLRKIKKLYRINRITKKHQFYDSWKKVVRKTPVEILIEIVNCLQGFFLFFTQATRPHLCPLHVAAFLGNLKLANHIIEKTKDYCPKNKHGWTPLHFVVLRGRLERQSLPRLGEFEDHELPIQQVIEKIGFKKILPNPDWGYLKTVCRYTGYGEKGKIQLENNIKLYNKMRASLKTGHVEICKLVLGKIDDKNPADNKGWTPLHLAAFNGHLDLCQTIIEQIDYNHLANNDKTEEEWTPLHWAVHKGHVDVCRLIINKANIMNPIFENGNTLLEFAVDVCQEIALDGCQLEVCKLLLENITDKNLANDAQLTEPLRLAILYASRNSYPYRVIMYMDICKLLWSNVEDKNAVLPMLNDNLRNGKTLKERLACRDGFGEKCLEVFKLGIQSLKLDY